jgi:sec-independent protein translocase protein TatB
VLDISPEKLLVLLAVGMVVLGPNRLPAAARGLAQGLVTARRLAAGLTDPLHASLAEPRRAFEETIADVKSAVADPLQSAGKPFVDAVSLPAFAPPPSAPPSPPAASAEPTFPAPSLTAAASLEPTFPAPSLTAAAPPVGSPSDPSFN